MADFLTVDLSSIMRSQKSTTTKTNTGSDSEVKVATPNKLPVEDWSTELDKRIEANNKLSTEARESEHTVEATFFEEYFKANWDDIDVAKQLVLMGEPLKKAIKVLGFNRKTNPILAFISNNYVIEALIKTKLLNASTFKAIYNAVAQKLVAHSQFLYANDYNIIYYPDLYKKPAVEILEYLKLQASIIDGAGGKYTRADLIKNKKVFLQLSAEEDFSKMLTDIKTKTVNVALQIEDASALKTIKVNDIALANQIKVELDKSSDNTNQTKTVKLKADKQKALVQKLGTPAKKLAAIQYLSMTTNSAKAKEALTKDIFKNVSNKDLMKATIAITSQLPKGILSVKDADSIVDMLTSDT